MEFKRESFDSHVDNDAKQSANFQDLFVFLNELMTVLQHTPASTSGTLLDDVCVVVLSEMGRTPYENGGKGKDHWQHTSAMLMGSGIRGGQTYGEFSSLFYGQPIDLQSGDVTASGQDISTRLLGDTLLALGDVGNEFTPLGDPIWSLRSSIQSLFYGSNPERLLIIQFRSTLQPNLGRHLHASSHQSNSHAGGIDAFSDVSP